MDWREITGHLSGGIGSRRLPFLHMRFLPVEGPVKAREGNENDNGGNDDDDHDNNREE